MKLIPLKAIDASGISGPPWSYGVPPASSNHASRRRWAGPPSGPLWGHENKHDGYRLMVRRDGERGRCFTRGGHDWAVAGNKYGCESLGGDWMMGTIMKRTNSMG